MTHSWKSYAVIFAISLAAIAAANKVRFIGNIVGN